MNILLMGMDARKLLRVIGPANETSMAFHMVHNRKESQNTSPQRDSRHFLLLRRL
jgi:hypothetical protein